MIWIIFLLINFVIINYFGNMKEALSIAAIEAVVGAYAVLNSTFCERERICFFIMFYLNNLFSN